MVTLVLATAIYDHFVHHKHNVNRASQFIYACLWVLILPKANPNFVLENGDNIKNYIVIAGSK